MRALALGVIAALAVAGTPVPSRALSWTALHFSTGVSFNHTLAVGDLNGDGKLDVATADSQASTAIVLLGNGDGTLAPFHTYPTASEPQDVQMADVTGDGVPDLATPDYSGGGISVLRGFGDGTFAPRKTYAVGNGLVSLVAVDLDGDGRRDLAASRESNNRIEVLVARPDSGFAASVPIATGTTPHQLAAADLDHDGHVDLTVASHAAAAVSVHRGMASSLPGSAMPFAAGGSPIGVTISDWNGDQDPDLVVSNVNAATVSVLLGRGDGSFDPPVAYPTDPRPRGMDAADLDGDGIPELVIATGYPDGDSALTLYHGAGDGTLMMRERIALPYRAADCVLADMNGDGRRDIVTTGPWAGRVTVLLNAATLAAPPLRTQEGNLSLEVHPNPVRGSATLRFRAMPGSEARLEIYDVAGRRVAAAGPFAGGGDVQVVPWPREAAAGRPGLYLARLIAGSEIVQRLVVLLPH